jgi:DNA-binding FadR family transcriptional regulator
MGDSKALVLPNKKMLTSIVDAHERIYQAIVHSDPDRARTEMSRHIIEVENYMLKLRNKSAVGSIL